MIQQQPTVYKMLCDLALDANAPVWDDLITCMSEDLNGVCQRIAGNDAVADDAMQNTWLRVRAHVHKFKAGERDPEIQARAWLRSVASTTTLSLLRSRTRAENRDRNWTPQQSECQDPSQQIIQQEMAAQVREVLAELPEREQMAITLRHLAGLPFEEVAQVMDCPIGSAKTWVRRSLKRMRRSLRSRGISASSLLLIAFLESIDAAEGIHAAQMTAGVSLVSTTNITNITLLKGAIIMSTLSAAAAAAIFASVTFMNPVKAAEDTEPVKIISERYGIIDSNTITTITQKNHSSLNHQKKVETARTSSPTIDNNSMAWTASGSHGYAASFTGITPVIAGDIVIFSGSQNVGAHTTDGKQLWERKVKSYHHRPAVSGGKVFIAERNKLTCVDLKTGSVHWSIIPIKGLGARAIGIDASPIVQGDMVLLASRTGSLHAYDQKSGATLWTFLSTNKANYMSISANNDTVYAVDWLNAVEAHDPTNGKILWRTDVIGIGANQPTIHKESLYFALHDIDQNKGYVCALDRESGAQIWKSLLQNDRKAIGSPVVANDIVVTTGGEFIHGLDAKTGKEIWQKKRSHFATENLVVDELGRVLMGGNEEISLIDSKTGENVFLISLREHFTDAQVKNMPHLMQSSRGQPMRMNLGVVAVPMPVNGRLYATASGGWFGAIDVPTMLPAAQEGNYLPLGNN